jgi:hypothetical protein
VEREFAKVCPSFLCTHSVESKSILTPLPFL